MALVFISHSSKDRNFVEGEVIPFLKGIGVDAWYSRDDIRTSADWEKSIREALDLCDWLLVILTPNSIHSEWVQCEVHWALENKKNRVIPLMLSRCDPSHLHIKLSKIQHLDYENDPTEARNRLASLLGSVDVHKGKEETARGLIPSARHRLSKISKYLIIRTLKNERTFLVEERDSGRTVVIHVYRPFDGIDNFERCIQDAHTAKRIEHPTITRVYDVIVDGEFCYVVREHIAGVLLGDVLASDRTVERSRVPVLFAEIAEGLQHVHAQGLVHGNLTPWEVILDAKLHPHICFPGFFEGGTPSYAQLAPGRFGRASNALDGRIDIWSVGFMMFEALTGRRPYRYEGPSTLSGITADPPSPMQFDPTIPNDLEQICLKCLAVQLHERYTTAAELAEDLWRFHRGQSVSRARRWFWPFSR
jgi:hypothetical protein